MKTYNVTICVRSYYEVEVEANTEDEAREKAWEADWDYGEESTDDPEIASVEEV